MQLKISTLVWTFIWSLFMGVTAISIGVGAAFPQLNYIAGPFVCLGGTMSTEQQAYNVSPVETVTTITWYCTDKSTGTKNELSMWPISIAAGLIYGLLLFLVIFAGMLIVARKRDPVRQKAVEESQPRFADDLLTSSAQAEVSQNKLREESLIAQAKIEELKALRDSNTISEAEYQKRRQEIMS